MSDWVVVTSDNPRTENALTILADVEAGVQKLGLKKFSAFDGDDPKPAANLQRGWKRGYTVEAAYAEFEEKEKGSLEAGKLADFVVISEDITRVAPKALLSVRVLKTYVGGKLVHDAHGQVLHAR